MCRIHITGGPGSGKTSLATRAAESTGLPIFHLDDVARVGGGIGPTRSPEDRSRLLDAIAARPGWITEGVHLGWTERLFQEADTIVWLDQVTWLRASRGIIVRFVRDATAAMRRRRTAGELLRFRDYARQLIGLGKAILESRAYYDTPATRSDGANDYVRGATAARVARHRHKLVHCRTQSDVDAFVASLAERPREGCREDSSSDGQR